MKNSNNTSTSDIGRRTFVKRTAGTILAFGVGTHAFAALGDGNTSCAIPISGIISAPPTKCGTWRANNATDNDPAAPGWAQLCAGAGAKFDCVINDSEFCANWKDPKKFKLTGPAPANQIMWCTVG